MVQTYFEDDIAIVGIGCIFPEAKDIKEFWNNIKKSKCAIRKLPESRLNTNIYYNPKRGVLDKTYSYNAGHVEDKILKNICKINKLNLENHSRLQLFGIEAARQAIIDLNKFDKNKTSIILGCMTPDPCLPKQKFILSNKKRLKKYIKENFDLKTEYLILKEINDYCKNNDIIQNTFESNIYPNSVTNIIKNKYQIKGENFIVDSACSSTHTAIEVAIEKLKLDKTETIITGGIGSSLGPESFISWSQIRGMAEDKCLPFDKNTKGMSQGEGSGIIILQKLKDAIKNNNKIYGIIKSIAGTSDGKSTSIFAPTKEGQINTYSKVYKNQSKEVNYIECHGTGTPIGDLAEIESLTTFFENKTIPIGSIKALIGHTKGAAGAAGIIKSLMIIKNKEIPKNSYFKTKHNFNTNLFINKNNLRIDTEIIRIGISSFGFGGINSHLLLEEYIKSNIIEKNIINLNNKIKNKNFIKNEKSEKDDNSDELVIISSSTITPEDFENNFSKYQFKIPKKSLLNIDKTQLKALMGVSNILNLPNINVSSIPNNKINVISASIIGLDKITELGKRINVLELYTILNKVDKKIIDKVVEYRNIYPQITEDTGAGILNNVIAGRVCNQFNFKGINFNVDSDTTSMPCALEIISNLIKKEENEGLYFLIFNDEYYDPKEFEIKRINLHCLLISSKEFALKNNLPIQSIIKEVKIK